MKLFGTDGIRGIAGSENMNAEMGFKMGKALVSFCEKRNWPRRIVIARDTRESGPGLEEAVVASVLATGGEAILAGILPTPGLAFLVGDQKAGMGLVISASHNPFEHNGLKPFKRDGTKLTNEEEKEIERYILENGSEGAKEAVSPGEKTILKEAREKYVDFLSGKIPKNFQPGKKKIILDCSNGATFEAAPAVFEKIAGELLLLHADPDGKNINEKCGSQHPENLREKVISEKADLGLAFDGDGDRVIAVDEKGDILNGDQIIYIIAKLLKAKGELKNDLVVTTVMSNLGFIDSLHKLGIQHIATGVGDRPVFFEMRREGAVLGGEESGHIICTDFYSIGDGIVGGLMLLAAMEYFQKPVSELAAEVTLFPKLLVNVPVKSKPELETVPEIIKAIKEVEKKLGSSGRVLVRYSGTENLCRVMVEGRDENEIKDYADKIAGVIKGCLG
jgi:phosphoglucosamine mutase